MSGRVKPHWFGIHHDVASSTKHNCDPGYALGSHPLGELPLADVGRIELRPCGVADVATYTRSKIVVIPNGGPVSSDHLYHAARSQLFRCFVCRITRIQGQAS